MTFTVQLQDKPARQRAITVQPGDQVFCGIYHGKIAWSDIPRSRVAVIWGNYGDGCTYGLRPYDFKLRRMNAGGLVQWEVEHLGVRA